MLMPPGIRVHLVTQLEQRAPPPRTATTADRRRPCGGPRLFSEDVLVCRYGGGPHTLRALVMSPPATMCILYQLGGAATTAVHGP